ncbi:MAG: DUF302 domain-containing protein [Deltaproteobacteria bacterium]|nr:MAG: DUF302 domain-containing protein [Deltaproteobacteria bacterium]
MEASGYGYVVSLSGVSPEEAKNRVVEALAAEGFGVLTEIDVKATLKKKLDVDFRPYVILGACNPKLAHRALSVEPAIGLLLPCNVVVEATDDGARISLVNPRAMFEVVKNTALNEVVKDADARLRRVAEALS